MFNEMKQITDTYQFMYYFLNLYIALLSFMKNIYKKQAGLAKKV